MDDKIFQMAILHTAGCWLICTLSSLSDLWSPFTTERLLTTHRMWPWKFGMCLLIP